MQKIATKVFIWASVAFGIFGVLMILSGGLEDGEMSNAFKIFQKLFFITVLVILPSFALSVAGKYLKSNQ